jgi:hypothetical protein
MTTDLSVFRINKNATLKLHREDSNEAFDLFPYDQIKISLQTMTENCVLVHEELDGTLTSFKYLLGRALEKKIHIHPSIKQNIGYTWDQVLHDKTSIEYVITPESGMWVGKKNLLWSTRSSGRPSLTTWLYNSDDLIVMEITPTYSWHFSDPKKGEKFIEYDEFMKSYKPFFKTIITPETAQKWIKQIDSLLAIVKENEKKAREADLATCAEDDK